MSSDITIKRSIFPKPLIDIIKQHRYIPRKLRSDEKLKANHRYWLPYYNGIIKIQEITKINNIDYYFLTFDNKFNAAIPYPLEVMGGYELLYNFNNIELMNMIDDGNYYTGAEIKFWFVIKNIDLNKGKYSGFWSYLDPRSGNTLIDNKKYKLEYRPDAKQKHNIIAEKK
jgi:hypothetical protein